MDPVRWITYRGSEILFIDVSGVKEKEEVHRRVEMAQEIIAAQPEKSVLVLTYVRDAVTDASTRDEMKAFAEHNAPYVLASAVVGLSTVQRVIYEAVRMLTGREIHAFDDLAPAKEWLSQQAKHAGAARD
jgi:predicted GTPase